MECPKCECKINSPAEAFLHQELHAEPWDTKFGLDQVPYVLMPRIAKMMQDYADAQTAAEARVVEAAAEYVTARAQFLSPDTPLSETRRMDAAYDRLSAAVSALLNLRGAAGEG